MAGLTIVHDVLMLVFLLMFSLVLVRPSVALRFWLVLVTPHAFPERRDVEGSESKTVHPSHMRR